MSFKAPEEVWDKIKDKPIQSVRESKAKGHPKKVWYAAAACIAACTVLISVLAVGKSLGLPASDSTLNTENGTERGGQIATDRAGEPEKKVPGETVSQTAEKTTAAVSHGGSVAGVCIPTYKVWNHRLYGYAGDNLALTDSDLGPLHREKINGTEIAVYSLKNIPMEQSIGDKKTVLSCAMTAYWTAFLSFAEKIRDSERNGLYLSRPRKGRVFRRSQRCEVL